MYQDEISPISIFESELEVIAGNSAAFGDRETGGELFGLRNRSGASVVMLATGPGPDAIHQGAHFRQDLDWFRTSNDELSLRFGIQYQGRHHSHHRLGLAEPSGGDARSMRSLARRNLMEQSLEVIVTHGLVRRNEIVSDAQERESDNSLSGFFRALMRTVTTPIPSEGDERDSNIQQLHVSVHVYQFQDARRECYRPCPVRVIEGESPIRTAIRQLERSDFTESILRAPRFPLACVRVSRLVGTSHETIPEPLLRQFEELPEHVKERSEVRCISRTIAFILPLDPHERLVVFFERIGMTCVAAYHHFKDGSSVNLVDSALKNDPRVTLAACYAASTNSGRITDAATEHRGAASQSNGRPDVGSNHDRHAPRQDEIR